MWNVHVTDKIMAYFYFVYSLLHNDVALIVFVLNFKTIRDNVKSFAHFYYFNFLRDWWRVNEMMLCLLLDNSLTVLNISKILKFMNTSLLLIANYIDFDHFY
jgi:hypothetical protein